MTQTVEKSDRRRCGGAEIAKKVEKEGSRRTVEGMDQQDDAGQAWRWNLSTGKWVTCPHVSACGTQAAEEERCVDDYFPVGFPLTCRLASCASKSEVAGRRRASRKKSSAAEGFGRRIK